MEQLAARRCFYHPRREAAARCLECGRFYCRECVTEHYGRVLCATCLHKRSASRAASGRNWGWLWTVLQGLTGLWAAWIFFYYLALILLSLPSDFHEGTLWKQP